MKKAFAIIGLILIATFILIVNGCYNDGRKQDNISLPPPPSPSMKMQGEAAKEMEQGMVMADDEFNTETYDRIYENEFLSVVQNPLSTFSIDVDTASYANMRRFLDQGMLPPPDAIRIEELINYFDYDYPPPTGGDPFSASLEITTCPWNTDHRLVRIGLKGKAVPQKERPAGNIVFLLDVSGSMNEPNKLPLLKRSMKLIVNQLTEKDTVAMAVYAGASGLVLPATKGDEKKKILEALEKLSAGGSTAGGAGIQLAYQVAEENFIKGGINRVILATDGDFNVGITNQGDLTRMIEDKAKSGVFLTVLGFGMGNYKDSTLEKLADKGNGNYGYIDTFNEARKILVEQFSGTMITIAKDVKIQVEFNPEKVYAYRLVGYENRMLKNEDFNDDKKDAGDIGAEHAVTAIYELVPPGKEMDLPGVDKLKYQKPAAVTGSVESDETMTVKLRYKKPDGDTSKLLVFPVIDKNEKFEDASTDFKFATAVASFGMILRDSKFKGNATFGAVEEIAMGAKGDDKQGYRAQFVNLVRTARDLKK